MEFSNQNSDRAHRPISQVFSVRFRVKFNEGAFTRFDYPMAVEGAGTYAFQIHGCGRPYRAGLNGHICAYVVMNENSARGPHGRGIQGTSGISEGWLKSQQRLETNRWYSIVFTKTMTSLSLSVDGIEVKEPYEYTDVPFVMKDIYSLQWSTDRSVVEVTDCELIQDMEDMEVIDEGRSVAIAIQGEQHDMTG